MAENSNIEWTKHTWSPWYGCTKVSDACDGCFAAHLMDTRLHRVQWGPHGERKRTSRGYWRQPLAWNKAAAAAGEHPGVFPSLCDPWDNKADPGIRREWFDLIRETPHLLWLLLTKRPGNILEMAEAAGGLPKNVALGATCEHQRALELNVRPLLEAARILTPAYTFLSCEPLLGGLNLRRIKAAVNGAAVLTLDALNGDWTASVEGPQANADLQGLLPLPGRLPPIGQIITGGETSQGSHKARPSNPMWFRSIRDQCAATGTPFLHKQHGSWVPGDYTGPWPGTVRGAHGEPLEVHDFGDGHFAAYCGKKAAGRLLDGVEHNGAPVVSL